MAIKLTDKVLNKLIMEALEEISQTSGGSYDPSAFERGSGLPFTKKGPKLGGAVSDMEQLFNMIQNDPKVPVHIKEFAADVLIKAPRTPTAKYGSEAELEEVPSANTKALDRDESFYTAPTADLPAKDYGDLPTVKGGRPTVKTSELPSPQAFGGPNKGRPPAPTLSKPDSGLFGKAKAGLKKVFGMKEQKMIESLVAEVLAEISAKERRDLEAHYGPDMRGAKASKKQLDKIDAAIKEKKERLKQLKDLKGRRGYQGEEMSGKKQNDKKIAELQKEIDKLEAELGTKKKSSTGSK